MSKVSSNKKLSKGARIFQFSVLGFLGLLFSIYFSIYVYELSGVVSMIKFNTEKACYTESVQLVASYKVNMDGTIDGEFLSGGSFSSSIDNLVLVSDLPAGADGYGMLYKDGTLVCKSVKSFAINYLIGSRLLFVTLGVLLILLLATIHSNDYRFIFRYPQVHISISILFIISLLLCIATLVVLE